MPEEDFHLELAIALSLSEQEQRATLPPAVPSRISAGNRPAVVQRTTDAENKQRRDSLREAELDVKSPWFVGKHVPKETVLVSVAGPRSESEFLPTRCAIVV